MSVKSYFTKEDSGINSGGFLKSILACVFSEQD